jgi:hypothetical protein
MKTPKTTNKPEEFFFQTIEIAQASAAAHEKTKLITVYPSKPWRSAVVTAFVTCPDDMAQEVGAAFVKAVDEAFARHSKEVSEAKANSRALIHASLSRFIELTELVDARRSLPIRL